MNYKLYECRDLLMPRHKKFPKQASLCNTAEDIRELIVRYIKVYALASRYDVIFISCLNETLKIECPQWEKLIIKLQDLLFHIAKLDGYVFEKFSSEDDSIAVLLPEDVEPGSTLLHGLIGGGFESMEFFREKLDLLTGRFITTSDLILAEKRF
ncbi:MAG: hypothetical protein JJE25_00050 [Bacteroidia bacterium]|nr:hypothetical protein [Bacteroidia bacterium]